MANCDKQQLNITCGTDVVLHDTLIFDGETFDPALSVGITANLVSSLGKRTALEVDVADGGLIIYVPWVERNAGYYGLEVTGTCNSKKWATYADSLIHYTRATEMGVAEVTIESDYYDITQVVGFRYSESPIKKVTATIDDEVGTPDVDADYDGKILSFEFHNMKGNRGNGIASSSEVLSPDDGGTNTHTFTDDDGNEHTFHTKNGRKGTQGDSFQPIEDVSGLVLAHTLGDDNTKAMSQKGVTDAINEEKEWEKTPIDLSEKTYIAWYIDDEHLWHKQSSSTPSYESCTYFPISGGETFRLTTQEGYGANIEFLASINYEAGASPQFATTMIGWLSEGTHLVTAPLNAKYVYLRRRRSRANVLPSYFARVELTKEHISSNDSKVAGIEGNLSSILTSLRKNATFGVQYETLTPSADDTYNCYVRTSYKNDCFQSNGDANKRLTYFPRKMVCQGTLSLTLTGLNTVDLIELPWRELDLSPMDCNYPLADTVKTVFYASEGARTVEINLRPTTKRVAFVMGSTQNVATSPSDITNNITSVSLPVADLSDFNFGNNEGSVSEEMELVQQASYKASASTHLPCLGLIHYSDIHASTKAAKALIGMRRTYLNYIGDMICTGDAPYDKAGAESTGTVWWQGTGLAEISLFTLGNHDCKDSSGSNGLGQSYGFSEYYEPYISGLGYVMPDGYDDPESPNYQACFWHKDYESAKIRVIGLDCMNRCDAILDPETGDIVTAGYKHLTNEQETWLIARLNETLAGSGNSAEGYGVIVCGHYPLDDFNGTDGVYDNELHKWQHGDGGVVVNEHGRISNFHQLTWESYTAEPPYHWYDRVGGVGKGTVNNIGEIIKYWMENNFVAVSNPEGAPILHKWYERSGEEGAYTYTRTKDSTIQQGKTYYTGADFIAFLCGHTHKDGLFYPKKYPNILNICANMTGEKRDSYYINRAIGNAVANYYSISTTMGLLKIVRLGIKSNMYLIPNNYLTYDYINKKVISEG